MGVRAMTAVFDCHELKSTEKLVLLAYADHSDHEGGNIFPSVETISRKTSLAPRSVRRITGRLLEAGYLIMVAEGGGKGRTNRYRIPLDTKQGPSVRVTKPDTVEANGSAPPEPEESKPGHSVRVTPNPDTQAPNPDSDDPNPDPVSANPDPVSGESSVTTKNHQEPPKGARPRATSRRKGPEIPRELRIEIPDFADRWERRIKAAKKRPTPTAEAAQLEALVEILRAHGPTPVLEAVEAATRGGYQGIFPEAHVRSGSGGRTDSELEEILDPGGWRRRAAGGGS